jgi:biotin operon repressor
MAGLLNWRCAWCFGGSGSLVAWVLVGFRNLGDTVKRQSHGHRWTDEELKSLMASWAEGWDVAIIADNLNVTRAAVLKMVVRLRSNGIPLAKRQAGHVAGRRNQPWTQEEVEYLVRRREQLATTEQIAIDLQRSWSSVQLMIGKLRKEGVPVKMLGCGVRRLWDPAKLMQSVAGRGLISETEEAPRLELVKAA